MKKTNWFAWLRNFFGFGKKEEKFIVVDIETGGLYDKKTPIYATEAYKVDHKKHYDAMNDLLNKVEESKIKNLQKGKDGFDEKLTDLKKSVDKHYSRPVDRVTPIISEPLPTPIIDDIIIFDEIVGEQALDENYSGFNSKFDGGDFSGGGAGADYSNTTPTYDNSPSYDSSPSYGSSSSYDSSSDNSSNYDDSTNRQDY